MLLLNIPSRYSDTQTLLSKIYSRNVHLLCKGVSQGALDTCFVFNCLAPLHEDVVQKTCTGWCSLSYLEEDAFGNRDMIYMDAILFFHCLLPDVHLGFNLLPLRYSDEELCSE